MVSRPDMSRFSRHTISVVGVSVIAFVFSGAVGASSAVAALAPGYGPLGESADPGISNIGGAGDVAVDDATGNVLFGDPYNDRVFVMAADLAPGSTAVASVLAQFTVVAPGGIAVDQSTHAVYVNEGVSSIGTPGGSQIERFVSDGAPVPTYTVDPSFVSPLLQHYGGPLAVDPASHDLLVGDVDHVNRYSSAGVFVRSFDGASSPGGVFTSVTDIAVGATKTYVINLTGDVYGGGGVSRLAQFDAQGVYERTLTGTDTPVGVAVDVRDRPVVVGNTAASLGGGQLATYDDGVVASVGTILGPGGGVQHFPVGVAADGGLSDRVYVSTTNNQIIGGDTGVAALVTGPGLRFGAVTSPAAGMIHLTGTVNPEGDATTARFEYCSLRDPCATDATIAWQQGPDIDAGSGVADLPVVSDVTGLLSHTSYRVRLSAVDSKTTVRTPRASVTTADSAPLVVTGPVADLSGSDATLTGSVAPLGIQSTYYFEYGETAGYGARVPVAVGGVAGDGFDARPVSRRISGLKPGTLYHYRLVAGNAAGSTVGTDKTMTTQGAEVVARAYEMVSPVDKHGIGADIGFAGTRVSADGDALMYGTAKSPFPGAQSSVFVPRVLSARTPSTWTTATLDEPLSNLGAGNLLYFGTLAVSSDVRRALVLSRKKLTDGAVEGGSNLYIREPGAAPASEYKLVATDPLLGILASENSPFRLAGVSDDLTTLAFSDTTQMYEAKLGVGLRLVSRMPNGNPATLPVGTPSNVFNDVHQVSADGSRIFFNVGNGAGALYVRKNGTTTVPISVSHRPGAPTTPVNAALIGASPDGRYVEFTTYCSCAIDGLTPGAPDVGGFYLYDVDTGQLKFLMEDVNSGVSRVPRPEDDGAIFYEESNTNTLDYARNGVVTKVADLVDAVTIMRGSDNGRYFVFVSTTKLTSYDNTGHSEIYLYDTVSKELSCPSCRTDGGPASGSVQLAAPATNETILARYKPRVVLDDGTVLFDTTDPLVGADVNGTRDVYAFRDGRASLISRGTLPTSSQFSEATPDGSNVFFTTDDQLVGQDKDTTIDMYDARVGGGLAGQSPKPGPAQCSGSECHEVASGPVTSDPPSSQEVDGADTAPAPASKPTVSILTSKLTTKTLRLVVQVSGRGQIRASGTRITTTARAATKAGKYALRIPLSRTTRAARKAHHKINIAVKVTFSPPFATPATAKFSRTLGK
jgi:hypothetical protein